jgi:hypothetical protein
MISASVIMRPLMGEISTVPSGHSCVARPIFDALDMWWARSAGEGVAFTTMEARMPVPRSSGDEVMNPYFEDLANVHPSELSIIPSTS